MKGEMAPTIICRDSWAVPGEVAPIVEREPPRLAVQYVDNIVPEAQDRPGMAPDCLFRAGDHEVVAVYQNMHGRVLGFLDDDLRLSSRAYARSFFFFSMFPKEVHSAMVISSIGINNRGFGGSGTFAISRHA